MAIKIVFEFEEKAIELPNGEILDIPERTDAIQSKLEEFEKSRTNRPEFTHYQNVLELLFGKNGFKKIAPKGKNENLDYLAKVYTTAVGLYFEEKEKIEQEELDKKMETMQKVTSSLNTIAPAFKHIK